MSYIIEGTTRNLMNNMIVAEAIAFCISFYGVHLVCDIGSQIAMGDLNDGKILRWVKEQKTQQRIRILVQKTTTE